LLAHKISPNRDPRSFESISMDKKISRKQMVDLLNEDLAREYQAIIAYVIYSQTMKGAEYNHIAQELEKHAGEELAHAIQIAKQIDYLMANQSTSRRK
jgi:Bacterioferritin (cytochrome b1)